MKYLFSFILAVAVCLSAAAQPADYITGLNEKYTSGLFRTGNARFLVPMNDPLALSNLSVFQYLQGRIPGLQVYGAGTPTPFLRYRAGIPAVYLDEMRLHPSTLAAVPMNDIAFIKVFTPPFMGGYGGGSGAIAVYTKEGDEETN